MVPSPELSLTFKSGTFPGNTAKQTEPQQSHKGGIALLSRQGGGKDRQCWKEAMPFSITHLLRRKPNYIYFLKELL